MPEERPTRVLDAGALKAVAHPIRFRLLELMLEEGPSTASELGRRLGESSGSTSYHLRQLAANGLIEEACELGCARDRFWRAVPGGWTFKGFDALEHPDTRADATVVLDEVRRARYERLTRWHREAPAWGRPWVDASVDLTARLALTRDETAELRDELLAVIDRWQDTVGERRNTRTAPDGSAMVNVNIDVFPFGDPPSESTDPLVDQLD